MVTTDEDNVVKGVITESDRLGNIKTYVEVGVDRIDSTVTGRDVRRHAGVHLYPLAIVLVSALSILVGAPDLALIGLIFIAVWAVGVAR